MRILFYLPVVTPSWFEAVVLPLIRTLRRHAEVHVLAPARWRNTGLSAAQLARCADLDDVHWHVVDGPGHESLRTAPDDLEGLTAFVRSIAADYTLCRAAETETAAGFPGIVRYLMEAGAPPLALDPWAVTLQESVLEFATMPALDDSEAERLDAAFAGRWQAAQDRFTQEMPYALPRGEALALMGLPDDRKIVALPLEHEHEELFFRRRFERGADLVTHLAAQLPADCVLALTDHPLNRFFGGDPAFQALAEGYDGRVRLVQLAQDGPVSTNLLAKHCDGMVVQDSKTFAAAAFFGRPMLRLSHRPSAEWLHVYDDVGTFFAAVRDGSAAIPDADAARRWFAWRVADEAFNPAAIGAAELIDRFQTSLSPARWRSALARYDQHQPRS